MIEVYDIETLACCFTHTGIDLTTNNIYQFIIHEDNNQINEYYEHLCKVKRQIGYNNLSFDGQVQQHIINNYKDWKELSGSEITKQIYSYTQYIIDKMNKGGWPDYPEWKLTIPQLDLFKIWHFDNRAKMTSLKWIEYMIDMDSIEEMPIHHNVSSVTKDDIKCILAYNLHDVKATLALFNITTGDTEHPLYKGNDKLKLRRDIRDEFRINCINYNDVKIGDELNKMSYCSLKQIDKKQLPKASEKVPDFKFKDCFPSYYKFETKVFNDFVNILGNQPVKLKKETKQTKKQSFEFSYNETVYTIAKGGIHSNDKARLIIPKENEILRDADIGSQYPNSINKRKLFPRHLGQEWLVGYSGNIERRINAKQLYKTTKESKYQSINEVFKLALNGGGFGKTNEPFSWQYDPLVAMSTTIGNQIEILMLIEDLEIAGIHVISANTDGIVCLFDKSKESIYNKVCKDWEKQVGNDVLGQLEYQDYKLLAQVSVNSYLAVKTNSEIKKKNEFVTDFELHKNKSARIVPIALEAYFVNNIPVETTITNHSNIYDFCCGVKSIGKNRLIAIDVKKQLEYPLQKINRYYISNEGINIVKRLPKLESKRDTQQLDIFGNVNDGSRESEIEAGWKSTIFNKYVDVEMSKRDINYQYYIKRCYKIIDQIIKE
jgi:hypothetical protein